MGTVCPADLIASRHLRWFVESFAPEWAADGMSDQCQDGHRAFAHHVDLDLAFTLSFDS